MPTLEDDEKDPLRDQREEAEKAEADWYLVGAIASLASWAAIGTVLPPVAFCALFVWTLRREQITLSRALEDPPRRDFNIPTRARSRRYIPGLLGTDLLAIATDHAIISSFRRNAYLEAMVRADERSQGATMVGATAAATARAREANYFLERARAAEVDKAIRYTGLGIAWADFAVTVAEADEAGAARTPAEAEVTFAEASSQVAGLTGFVTTDLGSPSSPAGSIALERGPAAIFDAVRDTSQLAIAGAAFYEDARSPLASQLARRASKELLWGEDFARLETAEPVALIERAAESLERGDPAKARSQLRSARLELPAAVSRPITSFRVREESEERLGLEEGSKPIGLPRSREDPEPSGD